MKDIWEDRVPGARGLCRETRRVQVVGVLFPALLSISSAGPTSQATRGSVSPRPPAPAAARTCPHLHSKVDTDPPTKEVRVKQW